MEGQELREGKARVRAVLIDPLEAGGMHTQAQTYLMGVPYEICCTSVAHP